MAINITSLFQDILESPEQKQQRQMMEGFKRRDNAVSGLTGMAQAAAPLVGTLAELQPQRNEMLQRGVGRLLGRDVRSTSEKVSDALQGFNPQDPQSVSKTTQMLQELGLGAQAAQLSSMVLEERQRAKALDQETGLRSLQQEQIVQEMKLLQSQASQSAIYRNSVADLVVGTPHENRAESIRNGSMPAAEVQKISEKLSEKPDMDIVQAIVDGQYMTLQTDGEGSFTDLAGKAMELKAGDTVIKGSLQGGLNDLSSLSPTVRGKILQNKGDALTFMAGAQNAIEYLEKNPNATTTVASLAGSVNSIAANARALAETLTITGTNSSAVGLLNESLYSKTWEELGITNAETKSMFLGLALSYAATSGQGEGRSLTDKDIERALQRVGAGQDDSKTSVRLLKLAMEDVDRSHRIKTEAMTGAAPDSIIPTVDITQYLNPQ